MLLECALLHECRDEYYTVDSLNAIFDTIPETCIIELLREAGFFYLRRDLRRSIFKTKPRAPGPDGIHNNLLKHLP